MSQAFLTTSACERAGICAGVREPSKCQKHNQSLPAAYGGDQTDVPVVALAII